MRTGMAHRAGQHAAKSVSSPATGDCLQTLFHDGCRLCVLGSLGLVALAGCEPNAYVPQPEPSLLWAQAAQSEDPVADAGAFCAAPSQVRQVVGCTPLDRDGNCAPRGCVALWEPVCGCDNRSYSISCEAMLEGVGVKHQGLCTASECIEVGGRLVLQESDLGCEDEDEQWMLSEEGKRCCRPQPRPTDVPCGGPEGLHCEAGSFCEVEPRAGGEGCHHHGSPRGFCTAIPTRCPDVYGRVCGCDRRTYNSRCDAHAAGVSVMHEGECDPLDCAAAGGRTVEMSARDFVFRRPLPCGKGEVAYSSIRDPASPAEQRTTCCVPETLPREDIFRSADGR